MQVDPDDILLQAAVTTAMPPNNLMHRIPLVPLTKSAFAPFGDVVELAGTPPITINQGFASRLDGLAHVDIAQGGGEVNVSLFVARARPLPISIELMEQHPLGSQLFYPLQDRQWLVLVCTDPRDRSSFQAFAASGRQGVNYACNVWHHPLLVQHDEERFLVIDRNGPGNNLVQAMLDEALTIDTR